MDGPGPAPAHGSGARRAAPAAVRRDRPPGAWRRALRGAVGVVALAAPVVAVAVALRAGSPAVQRWDVAVVTAATDAVRDAPGLHAALLVWQEATRPGYLVVAGTLACLWLRRRPDLRSRASWGVVALWAAWGTSTLVKVAVRRARPVLDDPLSHASGFSFPSGHAVGAAATGAVVTVVLWPLLRRRGRVLVPALAGAVAVTTALDRVLLGVHHPTDVLAGLALGGAVVAGSWTGATADGGRDRRAVAPAPASGPLSGAAP